MIHVATLGLYVLALLLWIRALSGQAPVTGSSRVAGWVAAAGVAAHLAALVTYAVTWRELPLMGLAPSLSTLAFLIGCGLVFTLAIGEASRVGILLVPLMVALEGTALAIGLRPTAGQYDFEGAWFALHVTLALASIGAMALAAAAGAFYLVQFRELKARRLGRVFHFLPPLATLDRIGRTGALTGLCTLSIALLLGWAWTTRFLNSLQVGHPKTLWAIFVWLAIASAVASRSGDEPERRGAVGNIVAFGLIVFSYVVTRVAVGGGLFI